MVSQSLHFSRPNWLLVWLVLPPLCSFPATHLEMRNTIGRATVSEAIPRNTSTLWIGADFRFVANISTFFNSLARATIFAALSYLICATIPGFLICLSPAPIHTLVKPTLLDMSLAGHLHESAATLFVRCGVVDKRALLPFKMNGTDSPLPLRLVVSTQKFVSWLLANDRPATHYPSLVAISTAHKVVLNFLSSCTGARRSAYITHKAGLLVLALSFTTVVQSVAVLKYVSSLKQAALVAPGLATTLGLDILASIPSLAFQHTQGEPKVSYYLLYLDP